MKKIIIVLLLSVVMLAAVSADTVVTVDVGYLVGIMQLDNATHTQHSLALNGSIFVGDAFKFFASVSSGLIIAHNISDGVINAYLNLDGLDSAVSFDILAGIGFRTFLGDSFLVMGGVGLHAYGSLLEDEYYSWSFLTGGFGGILNAVFLIEQDMGFNVGIKAGYDPIMISGSGSLSSQHVQTIAIMGYVGFSSSI